MKHYCDSWIQEWCEGNGWTDLFMERLNFYWAFPPGAVMPEPIPAHILRTIKAEKGLCEEEKMSLVLASVVTVGSVALSFIYLSPMPIVFAFAVDAVTVALLEVEDL